MSRFQRLLWSAIALICGAWAANLAAQSHVSLLSIEVLMLRNGSAQVSETWHVDVAEGITEWYLVKDNMRNMLIRDLKVTDETGKNFAVQPEWDIDLSREEKAGKCGIVDKETGYELCWGVGSSGLHSYTATYTITDLVQAFHESDGFNHMFVARELGSPPDSVAMTFRHVDSLFTIENTRMWAFGFHGDIHVVDGAVEVRTSEPFTKESGMIVMLEFNKGLYEPVVSNDMDFAQVRDKALENSGYYKEDDWMDSMERWLKKYLGDTLGDAVSLIIGLLIIVLSGVLIVLVLYLIIQIGGYGLIYLLMGLILGLGYVFSFKPIRVWWRRRKIFGSQKDLPWYRDIPFGGDLQKANAALNYLSCRYMPQYKNLCRAYLLSLAFRGLLQTEQHIDSKTKKISKVLRIRSEALIRNEGNAGNALENQLFDILNEAAGKNGLLEPGELSKWTKSNQGRFSKWYGQMSKNFQKSRLPDEEIKKLFGLRKFLKDFTLSNERGIKEVVLWNRYLIYATLFGEANRVRKDLKTYFPEYFQLSEAAHEFINNDDNFNLLQSVGTAAFIQANQACAYSSVSSHHSSGGSSSYRGGGGSSSFSGGGGYSGHSTGGGGR